jgi:basic membrane protein A
MNTKRGISQVQSVSIVAIIIIILVIAGSAYYITTIPSGATTVTQTQTTTVTGGTTTVTQSITQTSTITQTETTTVTPAPPNIACIYTISPSLNAWDLAALQALEKAKENLGTEFVGLEFVTDEEAERALRQLTGENDIIIATAATHIPAVMTVAPEFPEIIFGISNPPGVELPENVFVFEPIYEQSSYLAGMVAGSLTESNKIGMPVPMMLPLMIVFIEGFKLGAKFVNPDVEVLAVEYFSFTDPAAAKEAATAMTDLGCDVLVQLGGASDFGIIERADELDIYTVGIATLEAPGLYENNVVYSTYDFSGLLYEAILDIYLGNFEAKTYVGGVNEGVARLTYEHPEVVPEDMRALIQSQIDKIASGEVVIPRIYELGPP